MPSRSASSDLLDDAVFGSGGTRVETRPVMPTGLDDLASATAVDRFDRTVTKVAMVNMGNHVQITKDSPARCVLERRPRRPSGCDGTTTMKGNPR
ncbi:hypothetical protein SAMN05444157_2563 [Frankineae bacterium MT45]|nr:hypothetical protein SAMN05444157_2563 [Frankineae bacterium MT45]